MKLYRSFATVGGWTLLSRLFGFVRDILIAATLGSGWVADAFVVAFRFPNLFRRLFGEGAFNSAFVPIFAKKLEGEGPQAARTFAEEAMAGLLFILLIVTIFAELTMPFLMYGLAPGFDATPDKFELSVVLTRITMPYLLCMSLVALMSGVLNSVGRFFESAAVSVVLNLVMAVATLISLWLGYKREPEAGVIQAWAVFVAGFLQLALLIWGMHKAGMLLGLRWPRMTNDMRRLVQLGIPGVVSGGVTQINIAIGTVIASLEPGAVSQLYYADRVYELPLSIVGIAVGIVLLPDVARQLRAGNTAGVMDSQNRSLEFAMLLTIPATLALAVIPHDIVRVLFERGAFHPGDTAATASVLAMFALGLPAFVMIKVFSPIYFAREDTKTPMRYAVISLTANTTGSIALFFVLRELGMMPQLGIAIATTLGGWLNAYLLWAQLRKHDDFIADARLRRNIPLIIVASVAMVGGLVATSYLLTPYLGVEARFVEKTAALAIEIGIGVSIFGLFILAFGVMSFRQLGAFMGRGSKA
ncbi:integral membrane protein MviN [Hyphomicrobium denitrificans 1NES1]|uniref:Probable lipid II flippase MurJ n=1 Tax=Hyphomicrobium denitrificans 1NES1 TaxID=670307 RepID=N0B8M6_9HYPH|nr:murein biosynthesis integral membrane protein MurJ [Hyphomicrobium denitrificans]AGK59964.1 integral membrane protein MviN [Hyphomicrobium denitrificans 1NES1]